ncbi:LacI family DNA-binding transcriptional regulator [Histidinibacterium lentulum]|uniref:LacI family transcriptional regulator n=1 Tax=Histidinibacterium lentulum TaxID=2480588 RepID=A0A3N2R8J7_9RHOB|nr:LacI family DNA-binding transcriptional regulator [Histidinibacterium lentulum]ROU03711.1 LacI family transcriptional regulator [Histidinibacterium lentulum]
MTLADVAARAGVSRSAVSRTFTEGASVAAATRARVLKAAEALGYRPNRLASSLTTRRTGLVGLVVDNFRNPVFMTVFDGFTRLLQDRGYRPLLVNLSGETRAEASLALLQDYSVEGVIVASSTLPGDFAEAFHAAGLPVVHCFGRQAPDPALPVVGVDNIACGRLAAETLLARGYRRIGFLGGPRGATSTGDRLSGFLAGLGPLHPGISFAEAYSHEAGQTEMGRIIRAGDLAEAYFCGDDQLAIGALDALREAGLSVPGDVGILGMNDMAMAGWGAIALSTIRQPFPRIIAESVDRLLSRIETGVDPASCTLQAELVLRGTLRPL